MPRALPQMTGWAMTAWTGRGLGHRGKGCEFNHDVLSLRYPWNIQEAVRNKSLEHTKRTGSNANPRDRYTNEESGCEWIKVMETMGKWGKWCFW